MVLMVKDDVVGEGNGTVETVVEDTVKEITQGIVDV